MAATPLFASTRGGTRYHSTPMCEGLSSTAAAGDPIPQISRTEALRRKLLPCALCSRAGMTQVPPLRAVV